MKGPTLVVTDAFEDKGSVVVMPRFTADGPVREPFAVRVRRPDGTEVEAKATIDAAHLRGNGGSFAMYRLRLALDEVPVGSTIEPLG